MTKAFIFTSTTEIQKLIELLETPVQNTSEKPLYGNTAHIYGKTTGIITIAVIARNKGKKPIIETLIENDDINPKYFHSKSHHDPAKNIKIDKNSLTIKMTITHTMEDVELIISAPSIRELPEKYTVITFDNTEYKIKKMGRRKYLVNLNDSTIIDIENNYQNLITSISDNNKDIISIKDPMGYTLWSEQQTVSEKTVIATTDGTILCDTSLNTIYMQLRAGYDTIAIDANKHNIATNRIISITRTNVTE